jgi:alpha-L-fucosidase
MRSATLLALLALVPSLTRAEPAPDASASRMAWWKDAKFGMFIHWGVYSVPARQHEWVMHAEKIPVATYRGFAKEFNPVKFDPAAWAALAKESGMRYMVITAKHHEGFALYPSEVTDWDIAGASPYGKDLLGPLQTAAKAAGLKFGFYYSQAQDWVHPGGAKHKHPEDGGWDPAHRGSFDAYLKAIAFPQTRELITRYQPDIFWWDTPTHMNPERAKPFAEFLAQSPAIITNNRLGGGHQGDLATPENFVPVTGYPGNWETCMTLGKSWGFVKDDTDLKPVGQLVRKLCEIASKGGNFLLNVGPRPDGTIPEIMADRLRGVGRWLATNGESIYGSSAGPFPWLSWGCATRKGNRLYLHVFRWPGDGRLRVPLATGATAAKLLAAPDAKIAIAREPGRLVLTLPASAPDPDASVIALDLDAPPAPLPATTAGATATAPASQPGHGPENILDGTGEKRWLAPETARSGHVEIALAAPATIAGFGFDEPDVWPRMKQTYRLEAKTGETWTALASGTTDGHGIAESIAPVTAQVFRMTVECAKSAPGIAELLLFGPE